MKTIPTILLAAVLAACSSAPVLKYPTGENRIPINSKRDTTTAKTSEPAPDAPTQKQ